LENFAVAHGRAKVDSEQVIVERAIELLEPGGRLGLVVPDGLLNNQGHLSNCPQTRSFLATSGRIEAIVSLPDYAFRKSGAQNKTSILFFHKFTRQEARRFSRGLKAGASLAQALMESSNDYYTFLAEVNNVGYSTTGHPCSGNELYQSEDDGRLAKDQSGTVLGEWRRFQQQPDAYNGYIRPDCMAIRFSMLWEAHSSHRLDPKYHLFIREEQRPRPEAWVRRPISQVMRRRLMTVDPEQNPDRQFTVMTISQTREIRPREAGKGNNPPEWRGTYLADMPSIWYAAQENDVVYSSIDL
jgi:type I restriction enzyme M protein